jgi:catechol 2,3-dioxygenase-like lactoylglutathione lyase family enzyme
MKVANTQLWVHDQDEALTFYTEKLGMEVRNDVTLPEMGDFRWLTVSPAGQEDYSIVLMAIPGEPVMTEESAEQVRALMAKGFAGTVFITTDDCQASYEELRARVSSSPRRRKSVPTASTAASTTRRGTASG